MCCMRVCNEAGMKHAERAREGRCVAGVWLVLVEWAVNGGPHSPV